MLGFTARQNFEFHAAEGGGGGSCEDVEIEFFRVSRVPHLVVGEVFWRCNMFI